MSPEPRYSGNGKDGSWARQELTDLVADYLYEDDANTKSGEGEIREVKFSRGKMGQIVSKMFTDIIYLHPDYDDDGGLFYREKRRGFFNPFVPNEYYIQSGPRDRGLQRALGDGRLCGIWGCGSKNMMLIGYSARPGYTLKVRTIDGLAQRIGGPVVFYRQTEDYRYPSTFGVSFPYKTD